jgi:hypothetical protein
MVFPAAASRGDEGRERMGGAGGGEISVSLPRSPHENVVSTDFTTTEVNSPIIFVCSHVAYVLWCEPSHKLIFLSILGEINFLSHA